MYSVSHFCARTFRSLRVALCDAHDAVAAGQYLCPCTAVLRVNGLDGHVGVTAEGDDALLYCFQLALVE